MELDLIEYKASATINKDISYELSALINADSLFYGVFDYAKTLIWAARIPLSRISLLREELGKNDINIRKFKAGFYSTAYTIIPNEEYSSADSETLYEHVNHYESPNDYILRSDYSEQFGLRLIYSVPKEVVKLVNQAFDNCSMIHANFAQLETMPSNDESLVRLCFHDASFDLSVTQNNQLKLSNSFEYETVKDLLYFVGLTFERLGLDHRNQIIELGGLIDYEGEVVQMLKEYFGAVRYGNGYIKSDLERSEEHIHLPLYMISKCA